MEVLVHGELVMVVQALVVGSVVVGEVDKFAMRRVDKEVSVAGVLVNV